MTLWSWQPRGYLKRARRRYRKTQKLLNKLAKMAAPGYGDFRGRHQDQDMDDYPSVPTYPVPETTTPSAEGDCSGVGGVERACCNSALGCFQDFEKTMEDLDPGEGTGRDFVYACRKVGEELRRDKLCVKQNISRCRGPGKYLLQKKFNTKISNLYSQFIQQCDVVRTTTPGKEIASGRYGRRTTTTPAVNVKPNVSTNKAEASGAAIIAGAVIGGVVLILFIFLLVVFLRRKKPREASVTSSGSSSRHLFKTDTKRPPSVTPPQTQTGRHPLTRTESNQYAEIDERFIDPSYKPCLPPNYPAPRPGPVTNVGYTAPEGDVILSTTESSRQMPTTGTAAAAATSLPPLPLTSGTPNYLVLDSPELSEYEEPIERRSVRDRYDHINQGSSDTPANSYEPLDRKEQTSSGYYSKANHDGDQGNSHPDKQTLTGTDSTGHSSNRDSLDSRKSAPHMYFVLEPPTNV